MNAWLTERRPPWVVIADRDDPWPTAETAELRARGGEVVRLDGRRLSDAAAVFAAFADALSFPGYFGRNWDALVDCLHDRHFHGGGVPGTAVRIDHADALLGADFLGLFVSVLCQAAWQANLRLDADGLPQDLPACALHFLLLLDDTPPAAFAPAVASGMDVRVALDAGRLTATLSGEDWPTPPDPPRPELGCDRP
ncbi:barstar family protein [Streptomyces justiciae]|uniref:Barstar family protein n=1 Tax=Streptomyces justiciae TaxID=2780140 RepID=A0ABU3M2F7_9ACTN|nr:barstar family protein [Streptomyces justiciae]MDT7844957.1 barstar family protein [Streptomyces justiciae]